MPFISWSNKYSVEIDGIDKQHNKLVDYINELHDAMKAGKAKEKIGVIIDNLIKYTATHFTLEEKYMIETKYTGYLEHKKEHDMFVKKVVEFRKGFETGASSVSIDVLNFLRDWLINHILIIDKKYSPHLKEKGIK